MTLCDAVNDFRGKITLNSRDTRYCTFAPPEETVGVIDLSADGDGSRGIAFLIDRMMIRLGADARQIYYRDIRVTEILPSYETPFEDELVIASPAGSIRISDCGLNKFFLRQLINTICRMSNAMKEQDREALESRLTAEALSYYSGGGSLEDAPPVEESEPEKPESIPPVTVAAVAAVQEIAAAKKAAMSEIPASPITITEEKIQWLSGKQPSVPAEPEEMDSEPESLEDPGRGHELSSGFHCGDQFHAGGAFRNPRTGIPGPGYPGTVAGRGIRTAEVGDSTAAGSRAEAHTRAGQPGYLHKGEPPHTGTL